MRSLGRDFHALLSLFAKHDVRYLIVGGFATAVHCRPRYTDDLDLWVDCSTENAAKILAAIGELGFVSRDVSMRDLTQSDVITRLGAAPNCVDLLTGLSAIQFEEAYAKRVAVTVDEVMVAVLDRASWIANKRATGRTRDLADVEGLVP